MEYTAKQIIDESEKAFNLTERVNFTSVWDDCAYMARPSSTISARATRGQSLINNRLISTGINALNTFTAGLTSTLTPKGTKFVNYISSVKSEDVQRWLTESSSIVMSKLIESNFFSEISKCFSDLGLIGTCALLTEYDNEEQELIFKTIFVDRFAFTEDHIGLVRNAFIKYVYTPEQFKGKFPNVEVKKMDSYTVTQMIGPRDKNLIKSDSIAHKDRPYRSVYVLSNGGNDNKIIRDEGYDRNVVSICRWNQASNEIYGRSPTVEALDVLNMINAMEGSKSISAQRLANPQWLVSDTAGVRNLNNTIGGVVYWNGSNPQAEPKQLVLRDQPNLTDNYMNQKIKEVEDLFFMGVWNPLGGIGKQATATEVDNRVALARQNLVPRINIVVEQLLQPTFNTIFGLLMDSNVLPEPPKGIDFPVEVEFASASASIIKQIESASVMEVIQQIGYLAQLDPQVVDYINIDETAKQLANARNIPIDVLHTTDEVDKIRSDRAEKQREAEQQAKALEAQKVLNDTYAKTNKEPVEGSPADTIATQVKDNL